MKIKHLFVACTLTAVLFLSACSGSENSGLPKESTTPSPTQSTDNSDSVVIPTSSPTPVAYEGEKKSYGDLLAALIQGDMASKWVENTSDKDKLDGAEMSIRSKNGCLVYTYPTFQDAVDNDQGAYGDSWTTLGFFGQLGILLVDRSNCVETTSKVIRYPGLKDSLSESKALTASSENINDCLVRLSACFLDREVHLPERSSSSFDKALTELDELAKAGFCVDPYFSGGPGGLNSCEASTDNPGVQEGDLISEVSMDLDILRMAASSPSEQRFGKYMIYGDGWAVFMYNSTESHKQTFIEMNKVIKGTLIAKY